MRENWEYGRMVSTWSREEGEGAVLEVFKRINKPAEGESLVDRDSRYSDKALGGEE